MPRRIILSVLIFVSTALIVPVLHGMLGLSLDRCAGNPFNLRPDICRTFGSMLVMTGSAFLVASVIKIRVTGGGLPISPLPPSKLVTEGLYRMSRHPIYFSASLTFLGVSLMIPSFWMTVLAWPMFTMFYACYARMIEEPVLEARFGEEYQQYKARVPLIYPIPKIKWLVHFAKSFGRGLSAWVNHPKIIRFRGRKDGLYLEYGVITATGMVAAMILFVGLLNVLKPVSMLEYLDIGLTSFIVLWSFWSFANALTSADHGKATDSEVAVIYSNDIHRTVRGSSMLNKPLFPIQVVTAVTGLIILQVVLLIWSLRMLHHGFPGALIINLLGWFSFSLDWFRYQRKLAIGPLSWAQLICIAWILISTLKLSWFIEPNEPWYLKLIDYPPGNPLTWVTIGGALLVWLIALPVFSYNRFDLEPDPDSRSKDAS